LAAVSIAHAKSAHRLRRRAPEGMLCTFAMWEDLEIAASF